MRWARSIINSSMGCLCTVAIFLCTLSGAAYGQLTVPEVSIPSGAAVYGYPITVPPGVVAPNLTLTYNSQRKSSWVGMGWDLDVGYIQRSTKWGVDYNNNGEDPARPAFVVSLNGSNAELVRKSDWDSGGLTCFSSKTEGDLTQYCMTADNAWQATTTNGTTHYFGGTSASRLNSWSNTKMVFKWCLDKVRDMAGGYMTISYNRKAEQLYPGRIDYNYGTAGTAANWITFITEYMPSEEDESPQYIANFSASITDKVTSINVYGLDPSGAGVLIKSYLFSYNTYCSPLVECHFRVPSLLLSITEQSQDGTTLPPVTFTYQSSTMDFTTTTTSHIPIWDGAILYNSGAWKGFNLTGDFDGDGRTDIISWAAGSRGDHLNVNLSRTPSLGDQFRSEPWPWGGRGNFSLDPKGHPRIWVGDFNGDGRDDVATITSNGSIWIYISTGDDFKEAAWWNKWPDSSDSERLRLRAHTDARYTRVGDFNGDGRADLISWIESSRGRHIRVFLSNTTGDGFEVNDWDSTLYTGFEGLRLWLGDFNGDGKTDIAGWDKTYPTTRMIMHISNGSGFDQAVWEADSGARFYNDPSAGPLIWLGDFNGDGKTDIASWNGSDFGRSFWVHNSTGQSFASHMGSWSPGYAMNKDPKHGPWLGDFDGDGRTDIAVLKDYQTIEIYRSMGFIFERLPLAADVRGDISKGGRIWLGDFDGDGRTDIAAWNSNDFVKDHPFVSVHMHSYKDKPVRYLLSTVDDGLGGKSTIEYKSSSACTGIPVGEDTPDPPCFLALPLNIQIVSKIKAEDSGGNVSTTTYDYDSGRYVRTATEREFYGFKNIRATHSSGMAK